MKTSSATLAAVPRHIFLQNSFFRNSILISTLGLIGSLAATIAHAQTNLAKAKPQVLPAALMSTPRAIQLMATKALIGKARTTPFRNHSRWIWAAAITSTKCG